VKHCSSLVTAVAVLLLATLARPLLALGEWLVALAAYLQRRPAVGAWALAAAFAVAGVGAISYLGLRATPSPAPRVVVPSRPPRPPAPVRARWLASAGPYRVEHLAAARTHVSVDLRRPAAGVGHTTECSFECALRVFRRRYAPTFLVGRDRLGRVRIVQFLPLGEAAATMRNLPGGVETNGWARAQIEVAARSHAYQWQPDAAVMRAFSALLLTLRDAAGIPLARPYVDAFSSAADAWRRRDGKWGRVGGWFNHGEVPENNHWDMGGFRWRVALAEARREAQLVTAAPVDSPVKPQ
jgi:hypothetical protein